MAEVAISYAALILHDEGLDLNEDNLNKLLKASGVEVPSYWPGLFVRCLGERDIGDLLMKGGAGQAAGPAAPAAGGAAPKAAEEKKEEEKKKESSSSEAGADLGGGLFGGDDGW